MLTSLVYRFRQQAEFAAGYAPLYAQLFGFVADWLTAANAAEDEVVTWLLEAAHGRQSLDVTLLLLSGIHQKVLAGDESVQELALYYPTNPKRNLEARGGTEGTKQVAVASMSSSPLASLFRTAILTHRNFLYDWMQTGFVQTNETARGSVWLLPLAAQSWPEVELLDLGASAGLNLVADQRHYRFVSETGETLLELGRGRAPQFTMQCSGRFPLLNTPINQYTVISRTGLDIAPFHIHTTADELRLMSFVWADQPERLVRLREGVAALRQIQQSDAPVTLHPACLPEELPAFLTHLPASQTPLVIYNTYITQYFKDSADQLAQIIGRWALAQPRPVLWLQWEPYHDEHQQQAPELGWCAWTADLWRNESHQQWHLGWVHPHGTRVIGETGKE